ncbi:MAG: hypothetical protein HY686_05660 [Chloroflexi bacterium]|nr:hypothetical protein [Chloroflexota bacterium]
MAWAATLRQQGTVAPGRSAAREAPPLPVEVSRFLRRASELGLNPRPITLKALRPARGQRADTQSLRVSWTREREISLAGRRLLALQLPRRGTFDKYPPERLIMPVQAERLVTLLKPLPEVEEVAVLVEQEADPILAVRVAGHWLEVHRWWRRPYVICEEERAAAQANRARLPASTGERVTL